jgi:phage baseplate assembly protein W
MANNLLSTVDQKGLTFPIIIAEGTVALSGYKELIESSILNILHWPLHTLDFNPDFGSRLEELLGEQNTVVLATLVRKFLYDALTLYERRISILDISITIPTVSSMHVVVRYIILATSVVGELEITREIPAPDETN